MKAWEVRTKYCSKACALVYTSQAGWNKGKKGIQKVNSGSFQKGHSTWNKGLKGYMAGALNNKWKGGILQGVRKIRRSTELKDWRIKVFERDNYTCQKCDVKGTKLNAHHIKLFAKYPELRFDVNNGITLCNDCHKKTHWEQGLFCSTRLNEHQVARIKLLTEIVPQITYTKLGQLFGVDRTVISDLLNGKTRAYARM